MFFGLANLCYFVIHLVFEALDVFEHVVELSCLRVAGLICLSGFRVLNRFLFFLSFILKFHPCFGCFLIWMVDLFCHFGCLASSFSPLPVLSCLSLNSSYTVACLVSGFTRFLAGDWLTNDVTSSMWMPSVIGRGGRMHIRSAIATTTASKLFCGPYGFTSTIFVNVLQQSHLLHNIVLAMSSEFFSEVWIRSSIL